MAAPTGLLTLIGTNVYRVPAAAEIADPPTSANMVAVAVKANKIGVVTDVQPLSQEANISEFPVYGESVQRQVALPPSQGSFEFTFAISRDISGEVDHTTLLALNAGDDISLVIEDKKGDAATWDYIVGQVGGISKERPTAGVYTATISVALTQKPVTIDKA